MNAEEQSLLRRRGEFNVDSMLILRNPLAKRDDGHDRRRRLTEKLRFDDETKHDTGQLAQEDDVEDFLVPLVGGSRAHCWGVRCPL